MDFTIKVFVYKTAYMFSSIQAISRPTHCQRLCQRTYEHVFCVLLLTCLT